MPRCLARRARGRRDTGRTAVSSGDADREEPASGHGPASGAPAGARASRRRRRHPGGGAGRARGATAGRPVSRSRLRTTGRASPSRLHARRVADSHPRYRGEHRCLHRRRQLPLPPAAFRACRAPREHPGRQPRPGLDGGGQCRGIARQLPRLARAGPVVRPPGGLAQLVLLGRRSRGPQPDSRADPGRQDLAVVLRDARCAGGAWPQPFFRRRQYPAGTGSSS